LQFSLQAANPETYGYTLVHIFILICFFNTSVLFFLFNSSFTFSTQSVCVHATNVSKGIVQQIMLSVYLIPKGITV
jgi:hypothetical protein